MGAVEILTIIGIAIPAVLGIAGAVAEKTKNETDNEVVKWPQHSKSRDLYLWAGGTGSGFCF